MRKGLIRALALAKGKWIGPATYRLWPLLLGDSGAWEELIDDSVAYSKVVPYGAKPSASVLSIGGRSVCVNQLQQNTKSATSVGVTRTFSSGTLTCSGTATASSWWLNSSDNEWNWFANHKYLVSLGCADYDAVHGESTKNGIWYIPTSPQTDVNANIKIISLGADLYGYLQHKYSEGTEADAVFKPRIVDLTQWFGSGSEPSSVDDPKMAEVYAYLDAHPEYNAGSIKSAEVQSVESRGKNLFDISQENTSTTLSNSVVVTVEENSFVFNGTPTAYGIYNLRCPIFLKSGTTVCVTCIRSVESLGMRLRNSADSNKYIDVSGNGTPTTLTFDADYIQLYTGNTGTYSNDYIKDLQIEVNATATPYSPYKHDSIEIPQALREQYPLRSAGTAYDSYLFDTKKHDMLVGRTDMSTVPWVRSTGYAHPFFYASINDRKKGSNKNLLTADYNTIQSTYANVFGNNANDLDAAFSSDVGSVQIYIRDDAYSDVTTFNAHFTEANKWLYYELATPVETDISALLPSNSLAVESGGSVTFKQTDSELAVPSEIKYKVKLDEVEDGIDNLYQNLLGGILNDVNDGESV